MVGIYGIGGVGKTTIAKTVYNTIAENFETTCFCADVRENITKHGLVHIQQLTLNDILGKNDIRFRNPHRGSQVIKERLGNKRVLLVLDDVDDIKQLQSLASRRDWFGTGSRVIITTRDKQLLSSHGINKIYEAKELNQQEALELLCWKSFKTNQPKSGFEDVSNRIATYAGGIPLALEIIGSHLFGKDVEVWESAIDEKEKSMDMKIFGMLKVSYESLDCNTKEIFLDVACFFSGCEHDYFDKVLTRCGLSSKFGLDILEDRCLLKRQHGKLWMHDHIQSMGREIVRRESEREPGERCRIWFHRDALQILTRDTLKGTSKVQGLVLELPQREEVLWSGKAFKKMVNLKILIIRNAVFSKAPKGLPNSLIVLEWENYPSSSLPSNFQGNDLLRVSLENAPQTFQLQEPLQKFQNLTSLSIFNCKGLKEVPDLSSTPNLTVLNFGSCTNLVKIHDSIVFLDKLLFISAIDCLNLKELPTCNPFKSLQALDVSGCERLKILAVSQKILEQLVFYAPINPERGSQCALMQDLMDCHYSSVYYIFGALVPICFLCRSNKNSISFWVRRCFPDVHLSFAARAKDAQSFLISIFIGPFQIYRTIWNPRRQTSSVNIVWLSCLLPPEDRHNILQLLTSADWIRCDIRVNPIF